MSKQAHGCLKPTEFEYFFCLKYQRSWCNEHTRAILPCESPILGQLLDLIPLDKINLSPNWNPITHGTWQTSTASNINPKMKDRTFLKFQKKILIFYIQLQDWCWSICHVPGVIWFESGLRNIDFSCRY